MTTKPKNVAEHNAWLKEHHGFDITDRTRNYYNTATSQMEQQFQQSKLWKQICRDLPEYNDEYLLITGYPLFLEKSPPPILVKPFNSVLDKAYRKNVVLNQIISIISYSEI